jgi:hypothetical protein
MTRLIAITLAFFVASISINAQTDLSMREALYFTGTKGSTIDLKNDRYVSKGSTVTIAADLAKGCDKNTCEFNMGFIGFRSGNLGAALSTYGLISVEGGGLVGNTVFFAASESTKQAVLPVKLKLGPNRITFTIDPYKKTPESNERNNTFTVNVIVNRRGGNTGN